MSGLVFWLFIILTEGEADLELVYLEHPAYNNFHLLNNADDKDLRVANGLRDLHFYLEEQCKAIRHFIYK